MSDTININLIIKKEDLRDALEMLVGNERLDASAIKNLPDVAAALGALNGIQIVDGNYELGGNVNKNTLLSATTNRLFKIESIHIDENNAFTNVSLEIFGDGQYADSIKLLTKDVFTSPNPIVHLNIEAGGICQIGEISGTGAFFELSHLASKRFVDNRFGVDKRGLQLSQFGETDEEGTNANYSSLVGTSLVPKKYVDDAIDAIVIPEGYDSDDFNDDFATKTTDDLSEGATNKFFPEAPIDNNTYARRNQEWVSIAPTRKTALVLETDCYGATAGTSFAPFLGAAQSSGVVVAIASTVNHPGIVALRDSANNNGGYRIMTDILSILIGGGEKHVATWQIRSARSGIRIHIGFFDVTTLSEPVDCICLIGTSDGTTVSLTPRARANNTAQNLTPFEPNLNTWYTSEIIVNSDATEAIVRILTDDGTVVYTSDILTNLPTGASRQTGAGIAAFESTTDAAADIVWLDYMRLEINRELVR